MLLTMWAQKLKKLDDNNKFSILKGEYGSKKVMMKKYGNKVKDQIVWKQVRDGAQSQSLRIIKE